MNATGHEVRAMEIAAEALEQTPPERAAFLDEACRADPTLRSEVESLLQFERPAKGFIEKSAIEAHPEAVLSAPSLLPEGALKEGQNLEHFQILSLLGIGGMGEVYLAQDTVLSRAVAVKLIQRGRGRDLLRHFWHERKVLAGLNHPHIARLYDGAIGPEGQPYLVMEYVEGERLDEYCNKRRLGVEARLTLFRKVCAAVAYAHQQLVIHRDLKPANIRVTAEGEPKLLDFGIAKLLDPATTDPAEPTVTRATSMTVGYASPEQLRGEPVNTATDIYSLGVVLYEMLCGRRPFETQSRQPGDIAQSIREQSATRPSATEISEAVADARGTTPNRLRHQLAGDLDNIVLMAIRHEPARRYDSVSQLAEDIRRHLDGHPVAARKETLRYVGAKFVVRNKAAATVAALLLLTLLGGIVATTWQARRANEQRRQADEQRHRAERRFEDVRRLADSLVFEIHDSVRNLAGATPTRQLIVARALEYLSLLNKEADSPALRRDLATAYEKIGDIQGNPYSANLGDTDGALASYRKAEGLAESLTNSVDGKMELGRIYRALGDVLEVKGDFQGMSSYYSRSLDLYERLSRERPADFAVQDELARAYETSGDGFFRMADSHAKQLSAYQQSYLKRHLLVAMDPSVKNRRAEATIALKLGRTYMPEEARAVEGIQRAITLYDALSRENPDDLRLRRDHALSVFLLAEAFFDGSDFAAAVPVGRQALALRQSVAAADPADAQGQFDLASAEISLARSLAGAGQLGEAVPLAQSAAGAFETLMASDAGSAVYARNTAAAYETCGDEQSALNHWIEAKTFYEKAHALFTVLQANGKQRPNDATKPDDLSALIAHCEQNIVPTRK